jgi:Subtilase family
MSWGRDRASRRGGDDGCGDDHDGGTGKARHHSGMTFKGLPGVLAGPGYYYRPRSILVGATASEQPDLTRKLLRARGVPDEKLNERFAKAGLDVRAYLLPEDVNIPRLITTLRATDVGEAAPDVSPNYVFPGQPWWNGGPFGEPQNAQAFIDGRVPDPQSPAIAVLDTGYDPAIDNLHPGLAARIDHTASDDEVAVEVSGYFAQEGGHGTFVDGVIMRVAPDLRIRHAKVLDPEGVGDDATITLRVATDPAPVINLSLGGYTANDQPPTGLASALAKLGSSAVVVAAAGNNGSSRPFWPAAFQPVVAVGALDTTAGSPQRALWSNYGHWVNVYAPGVNVRSTYLSGDWKLATDPAPHYLGGWAHWSGTSFAAPQVAAEIAKAVQHGLPPRQAAHTVLGAARWLAGVGPVITPVPGVID